MSEQEFFLRSMIAVSQQFLNVYTSDNIYDKRIEKICSTAAHIATEMTKKAVCEWEIAHPVYPGTTNTLFNDIDI